MTNCTCPPGKKARYCPVHDPVDLQKLANLMDDRGLQFWGFHNVVDSVEKNLPDGYHNLLDFFCDYALARDLLSTGDLDPYIIPDDDEPEFEVYTVSFPTPKGKD